MRVALVYAVFFLSSQCWAFDFKGVVVGAFATPDDIYRRLGVSCGEGYEGVQVCNGEVTIAHEPASMNLVISPKGIVQRIALTLSPDAFDDVAPELIQKFGEPTRVTHSIVQNRMGAKYPQTVYLWSGKGGIQMLYMKYSGTLDRSTLDFSTKADRVLLQGDKRGRGKDL